MRSVSGQAAMRDRPKASILPQTPEDIEQLQPFDPPGYRGVDDQVTAVGVEAEHRSHEQERCPGRPSLRAARGGILDRVLGELARVAGERLGQAVVEETRRLRECRRRVALPRRGTRSCAGPMR